MIEGIIEVYDPFLGRCLAAAGDDVFADPIDNSEVGFRVSEVAVFPDGTQVVVSHDGRGHTEIWLTR